MPRPASATSIATVPSSARAPTWTALPVGEYLIAFEIRFVKTRSSASGSASTTGSDGSHSVVMRWVALPWRKMSTVASIAGSIFRGTRQSAGSSPRSIRERSSRSLTIRPRRRASRRMTSASRVTSSGGRRLTARISLNPCSAVSGVRSSCDAMATNADFARSSSSSSRLAVETRSASSDANRRCRETSRAFSRARPR